jgi:exosortase K
MKTKLATLTLGALIMWRIKRYYADASVEDLQWILAPTARLTTLLSGTAFGWEPGEGYLSRERLLLIEKACAGINFMIAAFGMVTFVLSRRIRSWSSGAGILLASLAASYVAAVAVNATRITVSMWLAAHAFHLPGVAAGQMHRFEGIVFYFGGLVLLHAVVQRFDSPYRPMRLTTPLVCYYALTLAVPLANGAGRQGAAFVEYALFVLALPLILVGLARVVETTIFRAFATPCGNRSLRRLRGLCGFPTTSARAPRWTAVTAATRRWRRPALGKP